MPRFPEGRHEKIGEGRGYGRDPVMQRQVRHLRVAHRVTAAAPRDGEQRDEVAARRAAHAEALGQRHEILHPEGVLELRERTESEAEGIARVAELQRHLAPYSVGHRFSF
jgi:hypothetical protein